MSQTDTIQIRVDQELKQSANNLFTDLGLDMATAVRLFLKQAVMQNAIPFSIKKEDPFYSATNQAWLEKSAQAYLKGQVKKHELINF